MRKIRFTERQIIAVLKFVKAGRTVKDVCREAAISEVSYYNWKAKYGGMETADIKKSKIWKTIIGGLNRCLLISALSAGHLKTSSQKKTLKPAIKRELVSYLTTQFAMILREACRTLSLSRTVYFYQPDIRRDEPAIHALTELAERYPRYGFKKLFQVLRRQGNTWNHKRVRRISCLLKLNFRRKGKQRLPVRNPAPLATPQALNQSGSIYFMHNALVCGRRFRNFNVVDDFNREALAIEIDLNIPAPRVIRVLYRAVASRGYPLKMRMNNGPQLVSLALAQCAEEHGVQLEFIKPGKLTQNAFIERFNRTYRTETLDFYLFRTLNEARKITERWLVEYNNELPRESLNNLTPEEYRLMAEKPEL